MKESSNQSRYTGEESRGGFSRYGWAAVAIATASGLLAYKKLSSKGTKDRYQARASFAINCTPETAYRFWRDFNNLPRFMRHLQSVKTTGNNQSEWTALGPMDTPVHWTAELVEDRPNERITWRSLPGSELENSGSVEFRPGVAGRGTIVTATMAYRPPAGGLGRIAATVMGKDPEFTVREDLRRFKALIETGEVPTAAGQTHGPRGIHGKTEQVLFRERGNQAPPQAASQQRQTA